MNKVRKGPSKATQAPDHSKQTETSDIAAQAYVRASRLFAYTDREERNDLMPDRPTEPEDAPAKDGDSGVLAQVQHIEKLLAYQQDTLASLAQRVKPILLPESTAEGKAGSGLIDNNTCLLTTGLRRLEGRLYQNNAAITSILRRIDL